MDETEEPQATKRNARTIRELRQLIGWIVAEMEICKRGRSGKPTFKVAKRRRRLRAALGKRKWTVQWLKAQAEKQKGILQVKTLQAWRKKIMEARAEDNVRVEQRGPGSLGKTPRGKPYGMRGPKSQ